MSGKKYEFLNIAKGIGILLVVIGHAITKDIAAGSAVWLVVRTFIYDIHMPLFFIVAGFLFDLYYIKYREKGYANYLAKKSKKYMIPYLVMNLFAIAVFVVIGLIPALKAIVPIPESLSGGVGAILKALVLLEGTIDEHLWFAYVMFVVLIFNYLVYGLIKGDKRGAYRNVLFIVALGLYLLSYAINMPSIILRTLRYNLYFNIGCVMKRMKYEGKLPLAADISVAVACVASFAVYMRFFYGTSFLPIVAGLLLAVIGTTGSICVFTLSDLLVGVKSVKKPFLFLNGCSYPIYLYHQPFIVSGTIVILTKLGFVPLISVPIAVAVGLGVTIAVYKLIVSKNKVLKLLFAGE